GKQNVVVLGWGLWQRRFGGADVVGKQVDFDGRRFIIVGVMPQGFAFPGPKSEFWAPLAVTPDRKTRVGYWIEMVARLKRGVTPVRQRTMEAAALASLAGAAGILASYVGIRGLLAVAPADLPRLDEIRIDGIVLVFAVSVTTGTAFLFGLWPAWRLSRVNLQ